jgi:DNA adenine methylase
MKYLGGKHGIGKLLVEVMTTICPPSSAPNGYLEPFCGSLGVFKNVTDKGYSRYTASDKQPDLIEMWKKVQSGTLKIPTNLTEEDYNRLKNAKSPNALKAVAGFGMSFGGKFFAGYSQRWLSASGRDYLKEFKSSIAKIKPVITKSTVHFKNKDFSTFEPQNMLVYCDPPYKGTQGYSTGTFDHQVFWDTMRTWSKHNCVFISEESAPSDFKVIWSRTKHRSLSRTNKFYSEERLYVHESCYTKMKAILKSVGKKTKSNKETRTKIVKTKTRKIRK